jgi:hypothetical protein
MPLAYPVNGTIVTNAGEAGPKCTTQIGNGTVQLDGSRCWILGGYAQIVLLSKGGNRFEIVFSGAVTRGVLPRGNRACARSDRRWIRDSSYHDRDVSLLGTIGRAQILGIRKRNALASLQDNSC